jgi:hypothetical protein
MRPGGCGHVIDDGVRREVLVTAVEPGRRLAWHWWADGGELSSVEITLLPAGRGTRVRVVEIAADRGPTGLSAQACARLSARAGGFGGTGVGAGRARVLVAAAGGAGRPGAAA